jgi:hypothetical protein
VPSTNTCPTIWNTPPAVWIDAISWCIRPSRPSNWQLNTAWVIDGCDTATLTRTPSMYTDSDRMRLWTVMVRPAACTVQSRRTP